MTEPNPNPLPDESPKPSVSVVRILVVAAIAAIIFGAVGWYLMPEYYERRQVEDIEAFNSWLSGDGPPPDVQNYLFSDEEMDAFRDEHREEQDQSN